MDCLENESVCSVRKENNLGYYRIHTIWNDNGFRINIASRDGAWTGEMKPENVRNISNELNIDPDKYLADCREILTTDDGKNGYFYAVENGSFTWKKMIDEESGIKVRMGSVMVQPVSFVDTIQNIIEVALKCKKNLREQLNFVKQEREKDLKRIAHFHKKLEELCDKKNLMETDLYSKFLLLLNSKKRKIQELESCVPYKEEPKHPDSSKNKAESKNLIDAYDMDTEDEDDKGAYSNKKEGFSNKKISSSEKKKLTDDFSKAKDICEVDESGAKEIEKIHSTSKLCLIADNDGAMVNDISLTPGSSSNETVQDIVAVKKDRNSSLPETKADILNFFFGPNG